jgi:folate-binding protein YgfZ
MLDSSKLNEAVSHAALADRSDRSRIEITGPDRAGFLHNLTTNEIKRLEAGRGCEAFVTSPQGKTIGYLIALVCRQRIIARTDPGGAVAVLPHLQKYGVFDDVTIVDQTPSTFEIHLVGPDAPRLVERAGGALPDEVEYAHVTTELEGCPVRVVRESPTPVPGLTIIGEKESVGSVMELLRWHGHEQGVATIDPAGFELLRIEAGTPVFGKDITEKNLPQEIGRDARTISFVKGCYLGQETVARLDALGHVNQILKGLLFQHPSPVPEPGMPLEDEGKRVGVLTSVAFSPSLGAPVALGFVRTTHATAGTSALVKLRDDTSITATVADLPMSVRG